MKQSVEVVRFTIMVIAGVCGIVLNSSIVALNFRFWRDITASGSYKKILFVIGLINIVFQGMLIIETMSEAFDFGVNRNRSLLILTLEFTVIGVNIWNTTWLSIFCCLRLINSSHSFFLKIQSKFFSSFSYLFAGSVLVSITIHFPLFWTTILISPQNTTDSHMFDYRYLLNYYYSVFSLLFSFSIPFFMTCVSIGLSVTTLLRHVWRIRNSESHLTSAQLQGHYRAVQTIITRVLLDILFFLIIVLGTSDPTILNSLVYSVFWIVVLMYPTTQAFVLIFGNPKLKSAMCGLMKAVI